MQSEFVINYKPHAGQQEVLDGILAHPGCDIYTIIAARGLGKCAPDDDTIDLANGRRVMLGELIGKTFDVLALGEDGRPYTAVARAFDNGIRDTIRLTTTSGRTIERTANHPLFNAVGWRKISDFKPGDRVAISMAPRFGTKHPDENWIKILAYTLACGSLTGSSVVYTKTQGVHIDEYRSCADALGYVLEPVDDISYRVTRKCWKRTSVSMMQRFRNIGLAGANSHTKFIPAEVFEYDKPALCLFLNRLFSGDGWACQAPDSNSQIGYSTTSVKMAMQIIDLLARLGIFALCHNKKTKLNGKVFPSFSIGIHDNDMVKAFVGTVGIFGKEEQIKTLNLRELKITGSKYACMPREVTAFIRQRYKTWHISKQIGRLNSSYAPTRAKISRYAEAFDCDKLRAMCRAPLVYDEVKTVARGRTCRTVGIEVPGFHNYLDRFFEHNTLFVTADIVLPVMLKRPGCQILWAAPTYKICKSPIDDVWKGVDERTGKRFIPQYDPNTGFKLWDYRSGEMEIVLFNNSVLSCRSCDNPDSIVSKGYNVIIVDEAALIDRQTFELQILGTARRHGCKIFIITTPRGKNWVYEYFLQGMDPSQPEYWSIKQPWWKRPDYPTNLQRLMRKLPEHIRKQEYEADFIGGGEQVFKNLDAIFQGPAIAFAEEEQEWERLPTEDERDRDTYVLAADLAKTTDYCVLGVLGINSRKLHYYARFNQRDYKYVLEKMRHVANRYEADVIFDATGVGAGLQDFVGRINNVHPFKFTNESKNEIVNKLAIACEFAEIHLPNLVTMRNEFEIFTYQLSRVGRLLYSAPSGKHDDTVMMVAMANWYADQVNGGEQVQDVEDYLEAMNTRPLSVIDAMIAEDD